jgi:RNA polymerase sigma-70 factor (ECF subfamily)
LESPIPIPTVGESRLPLLELNQLQPDLRAYAGSLLGRPEWVEDIVQDANLYLLENAGDFTPGTNFRAWAYSAVYFKVLAWRRDQMRNREDLFSEPTLEVISQAAAQAEPDSYNPRLDALKVCLAKLPAEDRAMLEWKYVEQRKLSDLALRQSGTANTYHQKLSRLRLALRACIRKQLARVPPSNPSPP